MSDREAILELLSLLLLDPRTGVLMALLVVAAVIDSKTLRIPNWLTMGGTVLALLVNANAAASMWSGLGVAVAGFAVGLLMLLPMWVLRILGAGDVKLMAMVGAFVGPWAALNATLYAVIAGGIAALAVATLKGSLGRLLQNLRFILTAALTPASGVWRDAPMAARMPSVGTLPYGICICIGSATYLVVRQLGLA